MTSLQIVSDLHLEFGKNIKIKPYAPHLALLGDIGNPFKPHYNRFMETQAAQFQMVFILLGNHEYYGIHTAEEVITKAKTICNAFENVKLLDRDSYQLTDNTLLLGCTLWSDITDDAALHMNDMNIQINNGSLLTADMYRSWHRRDVEFLRNEIAAHTDSNIVVLTHHAPSHIMQGKYKNSQLCSAFATPLEDLFQPPVIAWASGHVHSNVDTLIDGIRSVSNCKGYPGENTGYKQDVVITVP